jgi:DNA repair protein RadC
MDETENLMPREKMLQYGIETLTDVELLALFLRTGTRRQDVLAMRRRYCSVLVRCTPAFRG